MKELRAPLVMSRKISFRGPFSHDIGTLFNTHPMEAAFNLQKLLSGDYFANVIITGFPERLMFPKLSETLRKTQKISESFG